jgi:hypothetical protein
LVLSKALSNRFVRVLCEFLYSVLHTAEIITSGVELTSDCQLGGWCGTTSGLSTLNRDWIPERGARIARRDDREYREYLREEQRREAGCPARKPVLDQRGQATSLADSPNTTVLVRPFAAALVSSAKRGSDLL